ncbi:GNAT family N-acetyltransferase [Mucilaginibacter sp.]|uniref:GNAT family N-acetyltransferase n=1 Tax=Mucilaginibacter sp. TaxID=1882438 RepID=UPI0035BBC821
MLSKIEVRKVNNDADLQAAFAIRHQVLVVETNCPPHLERGNEDVSHHFLATVDGQPAGAARWRKTENGYKLERFAVLSQFRGGVGSALVKAVLDDLPADAGYVYLHAQTPAVGLYKKFGFITEGPEFEEAGIKHYKMVKE